MVNFWTGTILTISVHILIVWKLHFCLFQKENRTENVKILLENNYVNNGVTNDLK